MENSSNSISVYATEEEGSGTHVARISTVYNISNRNTRVTDTKLHNFKRCALLTLKLQLPQKSLPCLMDILVHIKWL